MRHRQAAELPLSEQMEKGQGKNQHSRVCLLASLSALFWLCLLYLHFTVLGGGNVIDTSPQLDPISLKEPSSFSESITIPVVGVKTEIERVFDNASRDEIPHHAKPITEKPRKKTKDSSGKKMQTYPFRRALRTVENKSDPCGGRYIYVHDLPPTFNEDMLKECRTLSLWTNMCKFTTNAGLGPPLENAEGVFSNLQWM